MRIELRRQNDAVHFVATTPGGQAIPIDGAPAVGGLGLGARPMELVLAALGGCSGIDVANLLARQRQPVADLVVTVDGERETGVEPALFRTIHVHFAVTPAGDCDEAKVARAVSLSMEKYCSVARILERTATITHSYAVHAAEAR